MPNSTPELEQRVARRRRRRRRRGAVRPDPAAPSPAGALDAAAGARAPRPRSGGTCVELLARNDTCERNLSFLGGGIWQHHVPAVCDEIVRRSEFLTPVWGTPSSDHGRNQAWFEFASQLGELVGMDFVGLARLQLGLRRGPRDPHGGADHRPRPACSFPRAISPERLAVIRTYCGCARARRHDRGRARRPRPRDRRPRPGRPRGEALGAHRGRALREPRRSSAAIEAERRRDRGDSRAATAPRRSSGSTRSRSACSRRRRDYGADIVVGTHPAARRAHVRAAAAPAASSPPATSRATRTSTRRCTSASPRRSPASTASGSPSSSRPRTASREEGNDWTGNSVYLWAVANAAYMALMGPEGFAELGRLIIARSHYAARRLAAIDGRRDRFPAGFFKEFVVGFDGTGKTVAEVNRGAPRARDLRRHGPLPRLPRARTERALLRHRGAHAGRPRPARRRASRRCVA